MAVNKIKQRLIETYGKLQESILFSHGICFDDTVIEVS